MEPTSHEVVKTIDAVLLTALIATWVLSGKYTAILDILILNGLILNYWLYKIYDKIK